MWLQILNQFSIRGGQICADVVAAERLAKVWHLAFACPEHPLSWKPVDIYKSTNARMFLETKLSTLAKIQANLFQKLQSDKKILKLGQLPHVARCKLLHIQSKKIQLHFSRDFMSEKCYQPRDSNPQPSCVDVSLYTASAHTLSIIFLLW